MNKQLIVKNFPIISNYESYKSYVMSIPNLSKEEEKSLFDSYLNNNSLLSLQKLILSQLKTVIHIASKYKSYGFLEEDLVQEGNIGLLKGIKNFNPNKDVRLYSYLLLWIKSEIQSFILSNWKIVKVATTKSLRKLFFSLKSTQQKLINDGVDKKQFFLKASQILEVPQEDVEIMDNYLNSSDVFINDDSDNNSFDIPSSDNPEYNYIMNIENPKIISKILTIKNSLPLNYQKIIDYRFFETPPKTHKEIGKLLNISSERVRQLENFAISKIRDNLLN